MAYIDLMAKGGALNSTTDRGVPRGRPGEAARRVALEALNRMEHGEFLAPTLNDLLARSGLAREDRALVTDLAYGAARRRILLDAALAPLLAKPERLPPAVREILRLGAYEILYRGTPAYAAVNAWVSLTKAEAKALSGLVNAVLRRVRPPATAGDPAVEASLPSWLYASLVRGLGAAAAGAASAAMLEPEPLWLTAFSEDAEAQLTREGATALPLQVSVHPGWPKSLRVRAPLSVDRLSAFELGLVQPQNPTSLAAALLLGAGTGDRVLDLASGGGVKSAVLAALGAEVTSVELNPRHVAAARKNLARLGLAAEHVIADLTHPLDLEPAPFVLLDAPCSGTGTLRGHPEIKLRLTPGDVTAAAARQGLMLESAAGVTAPGGMLQYAVCALTAEEGPAVVADFLDRHPEFQAEDFALPLTTLAVGAGRFVLPLEGLDGFYLARLRRRA